MMTLMLLLDTFVDQQTTAAIIVALNNFINKPAKIELAGLKLILINTFMKVIYLLIFLFLWLGKEAKAQENTKIQSLFKECGGIYFTEREKAYRYFEVYLDAINLKKGDKVASIGARSTTFEVSLSAFSDSIYFTLENIDSSCLNNKQIKEVLQALSPLFKNNLTNKFDIVIGNEYETNLAQDYFDKVILVNSLHEFTNVPEMIRNIHNICKQIAMLYIIEDLPFKKYEIHGGCNRLMLDELGVRDRIEPYGFQYIDKRIVGYRNGVAGRYMYIFKRI